MWFFASIFGSFSYTIIYMSFKHDTLLLHAKYWFEYLWIRGEWRAFLPDFFVCLWAVVQTSPSNLSYFSSKFEDKSRVFFRMPHTIWISSGKNNFQLWLLFYPNFFFLFSHWIKFKKSTIIQRVRKSSFKRNEI
jgi:hypothetical protein